MAEQLMQAWTAGGGAKQLVARLDANFVTMPITLNKSINAPIKRGALIQATAPDQPFVLSDTSTAMPTATDIIAILADDFDLTGAANNVKANAFVAGEFIKETVVAASKGTLTAADIVAIQELAMHQGIYFVHALYGTNTQSVTLMDAKDVPLALQTPPPEPPVTP